MRTLFGTPNIIDIGVSFLVIKKTYQNHPPKTSIFVKTNLVKPVGMNGVLGLVKVFFKILLHRLEDSRKGHEVGGGA